MPAPKNLTLSGPSKAVLIAALCLLVAQAARWLRPSTPDEPAAPLPIPVQPDEPEGEPYTAPGAVLPDALTQLDWHNSIRQTPLLVDPALCAAAADHAYWMHANRTMSHTGENGSSFADRLRNRGVRFSRGGENVARGYRDQKAVFEGWRSSRGHYANMVGSYDSFGYAYVDGYFCAVFASTAVSSDASFSSPELTLPEGLEPNDSMTLGSPQ